MDRRGETRRFLIALAGAAIACAPAIAAGDPPLHAARWLPAERQAHALSHRPRECLQPVRDAQRARRIAIGRAAFRTPLLLGGQAARAGLSCDSCHRNGRGNADFAFPGLSGAPGTADVTSSLMSSHRGDRIANPVAIPDLAAPPTRLKISRKHDDPALAAFVRGLIVEEFDGPEPSALTLEAIAEYVRALTPLACSGGEERIALSGYLDDARAAVLAARYAFDARDPAAARLMLGSARTALGFIDERYAAPDLARDRQSVRESDLELAAIQQAIDAGRDDVPVRIAAWLARLPRWSETLRRDEAQSLFDAERLRAALSPD